MEHPSVKILLPDFALMEDEVRKKNDIYVVPIVYLASDEERPGKCYNFQMVRLA